MCIEVHPLFTLIQAVHQPPLLPDLQSATLLAAHPPYIRI